MQIGEYITDRWMPAMIREACERRGIMVVGFSDDWLLELRRGEQVARILGYKFDLNNLVAGGIAQDKVAAYDLLTYHDIPAVEHRLIRTKASEVNWKNWPWQNGMVMKPLTGTSGHGVGLVHSVTEAEAWMDERGIEAWTASAYLDIQREVRMVVLDSDVLLAYEKQPVVVDDLKMFNLGKGATPKEYEPSEKLKSLAIETLHTLGLRLAAIDIVELPGGEYKVLEVNDGFMVEHYARASAENKATAQALYDTIVEAMFAK